MKKIIFGILALAALMGGSASAADLPRPAPPIYKAPASVPPPAFSWTGFYIGGNAGYAWMNSTDTVTAANAAAVGFVTGATIATSLPLNPKGFIGGGQIGYNWQVSPMWVVGLETDFSGADVHNTVSLPGPNEPTRIMTANERLDWLGTFRGRVGVTPWDHGLLYVTGGLAYGHGSLSTALTRPGFGSPPAPPNGCGGFNNCQSGSVSATNAGWTVGGGAEWAFTNNWSVRAEYLYYNIGSLSHAMVDPFFPAVFNASANLKGSIARGGVNFRFN